MFINDNKISLYIYIYCHYVNGTVSYNLNRVLWCSKCTLKWGIGLKSKGPWENFKNQKESHATQLHEAQ